MKAVVVVIFSIIAIGIQAQSIKGKVRDQQGLEFASVLLLNKLDSSMVGYAMTDKEGSFIISNVAKGDYLLQSNMIGYDTKWISISFKMDTLLPDILLIPSINQLDEIKITATANSITLSKDTVQYNASAYGVRPGDMAEDLLKKLPGIEKQRDGTFKAYGEKVDKVLVDGKEFFGKDTRTATKNIDAEAIDKVQVFDKKSEEADFTGIDDGNEERTINLKLKEDKRVGQFGNIEAGVTTDGNHRVRGNVNRFSPGNRLSLIANANNINEEVFSLEDYIEMMGGIGALLGGGGGTINLESPIGGMLGDNQGITSALASGINFNKIISEKTELTAYSQLLLNQRNLTKNTLQSNFTNNDVFSNNRYVNSLADMLMSKTDVSLKSKINNDQRFTINLSNNINGNNQADDSEEETSTNQGSIFNQNSRNASTVSDGYSFNASAKWMRKFTKPGRSMSVRSAYKFGKLTAINDVNSNTSLFRPTANIIKLNQEQEFANDDNQATFSFSTNERIHKNGYFSLLASYNRFEDNTDNIFNDRRNASLVRNNELSGQFYRIQNNLKPTVKYSFTKSKIKFNSSLSYEHIDLWSKYAKLDAKEFENTYNAILPQMRIEYQKGMGNRMQINYSTTQRIPDIMQMQPLESNLDPLNIFRGNPLVRPEYNHNLAFNFFRYSMFENRMFTGGINMTHIRNKIENNVFVDEFRRRISTPQNTDHSSRFSSNIDFSTPIKSLRAIIKIKLDGGLTNQVLLINQDAQRINRWSRGGKLSVENKNKKHFDFTIGYAYNRNSSSSAISIQANQWFTEQTIEGEFSTEVKGFKLRTNLDYNIYTQSYDANTYSFPLLKMEISKFIGKDKKWKIGLNGFDLLNQNRGINRRNELNYNEVTTSNVLGRYVSLSLGYNLKGYKG
jgi:hypothetical protein